MRIVSLNAWGGTLWPALADWLPRVGPDVLCLQEVTRRIAPSGDWLVYGDAYRRLDQRADLFGDVCRLLPGHLPWFAPATRGLLTDSEGREVWSEHGLGMWIAPHLAVTERLQRFVVGSFRADGWGPEPVPRSFQAARLHRAGGDPLVVAHIHGLRDPAGKGDTPARRDQALAVRAALNAIGTEGDGVVLAGDFNLLPDSETFAILGQAGLRDLVTEQGHADTRTSHYRKPVRHANYCLVNGRVPVAAFDVPAQPEVSDHRPLILDLQPAGQGATTQG